MSRTNWSDYGAKRLDFGALKGGKSEYIVAAVLGAIILLAGIMIWRSASGPAQMKGPDWFMYKCEKCGHEFKKDVKDLPRAQHYADEAEMMKLDCPSCKASKTSWQMRECPNCHKYFIPPSQVARWDALRRGRAGEPEGVRDICPHCQTDINKWYLDHRQKK